MIKSIFKLLVFILDDKEFSYKFLSLNESKIEIPSIDIESYFNIDKAVHHIFSQYIDNIDFTKYIIPKFGDITIDDTVNLYYYCFITHNVSVRNAYKLPISQYEENLPNIQKIIKSLLQ